MGSNHRRLLIMLSALAAIVVACGVFAPAATPQPAAAGHTLADAAPLFSDDFSTREGGWKTETTTTDVIGYADGGLRFKVWSPHYFAVSRLGGQTYKDIHIEATVRDRDPNHSHTLGLVCGQQADGTGYYFALDTNNQAFEIAKRSTGESPDVTLTGNAGWTIDHAVPQNAGSYRLGADCSGDSVTFYVDGHLLQSVKDSSYPVGAVGVFVSSEDASAGPVIFDDFVVAGMR